jgi:ABC-type dipeptide/oligopeptide/nickel transport system ATPase component
MEVTIQDKLFRYIETSIRQVDNQKQLSIQFEVSTETIELHDKVINHFIKIRSLLETNKLSINYINHFQNEIDYTLDLFPYRNYKINQLQPNLFEIAKKQIETHNRDVKNQLERVNFNFNFFEKLGFLKDNIVAVGANGSGKTSLSNGLKNYLPQNGVVISAQKVLIIPTFSGISNFELTSQKLQTTQKADKSLKITYSTEHNGNSYGILTQLGGELQILLDNLLAERSSIRNKFCDSLSNGSGDTIVPLTKLDKTLTIWNSLIQHRTIECTDGINITLKAIEGVPYPGHQMSDGEKVTLYLIAQVLQAPTSGFIIIDEPEMYLHKTILNKLWDKLERERGDCIFIYLTHDLDFAVSRSSARKIWIRSFTYPDKWEVENIQENEIPEALLLELLGSRKNILFCEGRKGSIDEKIYNILFPEYTICPVEGCFSVINYTKSFNKIPNSLIRAYGIIDKDHHTSERLVKLKSDNIFSISMTEPENLLLDSAFLKIVAKQLLKEEEVVKQIQEEIIETCKNEIELQTANFLTAKINYYFNDSHVSKGNTFIEVSNNYLAFTQKIKIDEWFRIRRGELERMINTKDYEGILSVFNHKGLKSIANKHLKISDFSDRAQKILVHEPEARELLKKYFPEEIK